MMGERKSRQDRLFYKFCLEDVVPADHLLRRIDDVLDLSWLRAALTPYYSHTGRPSVDPELMIRMMVIGYCYSIRSDRLSTAAGICTGAAAQKCTTGSVVACPRSPWEGPARGATRPPRGWRSTPGPARARQLQECLAPAAQAAPRHGRSGSQPA